MNVKSVVGAVVERFAGPRNKKGQLLTDEGAEVVDGRPMAPPIGYKPSPSIAEQIRLMVRSERLAAAAEAAGVETFEEADDFDIADDPVDPSTPYEQNFEGGSVRELKARAKKAQDDLAAAEAADRKRRRSPPARPAEPSGGRPEGDGDPSESDEVE